MSLFDQIANPAQADVVGSYEKGRTRQLGIRQDDIAESQQQRLLSLQGRQDQARDMAGEVLGQTIGGRLGDIAALDSETAQEFAKIMDIPISSTGRLKNFMGITIAATQLLEGGMVEEAAAVLADEATKIESLTGQPAEKLRIAQQAILSGDEEKINGFMSVGRALLASRQNQGATGEMRNREALRKDLKSDDEEIRTSAAIALRLEPGAIGSSAQTIADLGTSEHVAESEAIIKERIKFADMTGASRGKAIDSGFETIAKINKNISNLERAITAIDEGASTGAIESRFFPSFRKSTMQLEALRKELALDVIGAVTFGALSQGELDLAQEVALPTNLEPADLKKHIEGKIAAQEKLRGYYEAQIDHLDTGGSLASFLRMKKRGAKPMIGDDSGEPTGLEDVSMEDLIKISKGR